jgi:hypothetical protein
MLVEKDIYIGGGDLRLDINHGGIIENKVIRS